MHLSDICHKETQLSCYAHLLFYFFKETACVFSFLCLEVHFYLNSFSSLWISTNQSPDPNSALSTSGLFFFCEFHQHKHKTLDLIIRNFGLKVPVLWLGMFILNTRIFILENCMIPLLFTPITLLNYYFLSRHGTFFSFGKNLDL